LTISPISTFSKNENEPNSNPIFIAKTNPHPHHAGSPCGSRIRLGFKALLKGFKGI
jgi:hypothetical protein